MIWKLKEQLRGCKVQEVRKLKIRLLRALPPERFMTALKSQCATKESTPTSDLLMFSKADLPQQRHASCLPLLVISSRAWTQFLSNSSSRV